MVKTLTILGARPQFIKAAPVLKLLNNDILVHTGQHYHQFMSDVFFKGLNIKEPDYKLDVGSGSHLWQIAKIIEGLEPIIYNECPDCIIVYGDTNSTLAGAYAAKKMNISLVHIEAGLRSFNYDMPEEINRVLTDRLSDKLFCPTKTAYKNLKKENLSENAVITGDTMLDLILEYKEKYDREKLKTYDVKEKEFYLCTLHRPINVDDIENLSIILNAFKDFNKPIIFPVHPRTQKTLRNIIIPDNVITISPVSYLDMITFIIAAKKVITDSGGLQKEAHILGTPCVTLRNETEWTESIESGLNTLCCIDKIEILQKVYSEVKHKLGFAVYGDGKASQRIVECING